MTRRTAATALLIGVASLAYELVQVRMLSFLLGGSMDFLAIPLALLGLAMGSMVCHYGWRGSLESLVTLCARALFPVMTVCLLTVFLVVDYMFPEIQAFRGYADPWNEAGRVVVYSAVFLPPYMLFGAMLAALFSANAERMGRLYFFDLLGAGLGCVLTPAMLTVADLPETLVAVLAVALGLMMLHPPRRQAWLAGAVSVWVVLAGLAPMGRVFREHPDPTALARSALRAYIDEGIEIEEVDVSWNEIARTALVRVPPHGPYSIVQDNGLSNVWVMGWSEADRGTQLPIDAGHRGLPWLMGLEPERILVIFAGIGRDMVTFDRLADGQAEIVGVELNPDVVRMTSHPLLRHEGLADFVAQPNIHLVNAEGRDFLNGDDRTWQLIHVANNGAVNAVRTGHTRKFLDTEQAVAAYLERLDPEGMLVFSNQPSADKIGALHRVVAERGYKPLAESMLMWGYSGNPDLDSLLYKPSGITQGDIAMLLEMMRKHEPTRKVLYAPDRPGVRRITRLVSGERVLDRVTDDRPFTRRLALSQLQVFPDRVPEPWRLSTWIKVFTVVLFSGVAGLVALISVVAGGRPARIPAGWALYLLASGVGYMCVEIGLIARTELILGNPLYSVAINLALFLVSNAVGSAIADRWSPLNTPLQLAVGVLVGVAWGLVAVEVATATLLSAPLIVKVFGVACATVPVGIVLGMFYPWCVTRLAASGRSQGVPITYALTTLASVLGSSFAMTAIIDLGFTRVIGLGALAYALAAVAAWRAERNEASTGVLRR